MRVAPRGGAFAVLLQPPERVIDAVGQREVADALVEVVERHLREQRHRVAAQLLPARRIEVLEQAHGAGVPAPPHVPRKRPEPALERPDRLVALADLRDEGTDLARRQQQRGDLVVGEAALLDRLHDQHALQQLPVDQGDAEERVVRVLAGLREVLEARMPLHVRRLDRPQLLGDQPRESFVQLHPDLADALGAQADGGGQHQMGPVRFEQVYRADVHPHPGLELPDAGRQGRRRVAGSCGQAHASRESPGERAASLDRHGEGAAPSRRAGGASRAARPVRTGRSGVRGAQNAT